LYICTYDELSALLRLQTYTYDIKPIKDNIRGSEDKLLLIGGSTASTNSSTGGGGMSGSDQGSNVHSYEVREGFSKTTSNYH
jgi:hypothetical protein